MQADIEESGTEVTLGHLPIVQGNDDHLLRLFENLIGNAIKFRDRGRTCRIDVDARPVPEGWLFWVRDNGIGIETDYINKLFKLGVEGRVHKSALRIPGSGYGLHICKKIVTGHGGRIRAESQFGQGTTFYFTLPHVPPAP